MFFFGAASSIYVGGNDIFEVMLNLNQILFYLSVLVLGLNIWTTNDNALYSSGLGLSNIFGFSKKTMVLIAGIIGTVTAVWLYWNFCGWLNKPISVNSTDFAKLFEFLGSSSSSIVSSGMSDDALYHINTTPEGSAVGVDDFMNFLNEDN